MKMAEKRSVVDGTLRVTASSGIFTQDLEDNVGTMIDVTPEPARVASGTRQASPSVAPMVNNAAMDAFLTGDPGPVSDAEMVAAVDSPEDLPDCPNGHGPMAESQYGGWWCKTCKAKVR
jgi:hypothetical protein